MPAARRMGTIEGQPPHRRGARSLPRGRLDLGQNTGSSSWAGWTGRHGPRATGRRGAHLAARPRVVIQAIGIPVMRVLFGARADGCRSSFLNVVRSGWSGHRREPCASGRQRHGLHAFRARYRPQVAGTPEGDGSADAPRSLRLQSISSLPGQEAIYVNLRNLRRRACAVHGREAIDAHECAVLSRRPGRVIAGYDRI